MKDALVVVLSIAWENLVQLTCIYLTEEKG
jgi:hypothetical protein